MEICKTTIIHREHYRGYSIAFEESVFPSGSVIIYTWNRGFTHCQHQTLESAKMHIDRTFLNQ